MEWKGRSVLGEMLTVYKKLIHKMNVKENWSVLKYIGETAAATNLTHGRYYYWPCSVNALNMKA